MNVDESWRSPQFRQQVRKKLEDTFKSFQSSESNRDFNQLEATIFNNSKYRDDYIRNACKVIAAFKDKSRQQAQQATMSANLGDENLTLAGVHGDNQIRVKTEPIEGVQQMQQLNPNQVSIQIQTMGTAQSPQIKLTTISTGGPLIVHHQHIQPQQSVKNEPDNITIQMGSASTINLLLNYN